MKNRFDAGFVVLLLGVVACEPVIAIGWREGIFILLLTILLIGPPVYRFLRRLEKAREKNRRSDT